jgi:glycerol-3-phosphate O-acyltransferase / dihydroxyacetone phosphate acyltransferase
VAPLRTGAARIALGAEAGADWQLGLRIVPVGLNYHRKSSFRGRVLAVIGEPFTIAHMRDAWEADPAAAARALTDEIAARLHAVTVNVAERQDAGLIDTAERMYAREKGVSTWRERDPLAGRVPRLRAFARGLAWLREHDPARHERLARAVARYRRRAELLGAADGDVPPRYSAGDTVRTCSAAAARCSSPHPWHWPALPSGMRRTVRPHSRCASCGPTRTPWPRTSWLPASSWCRSPSPWA